jgi:CHAD domain-containing protein
MFKQRDPGGSVWVTFTLPAAVGATRAVICGEWNNWAPNRDVMEPTPDGFELTLEFTPGRIYRFRYLLDGWRWENDWRADGYVPNGYGSDDSVLNLTESGLPPRVLAVELGDPSPPATPADPSTTADRALEREAKLAAPPGLGLPDLGGLLPGATALSLPVRRLDATYYDTTDLRLARSGITLRHRGGESGPAWTVKLPENGHGRGLVRSEIRFEGSADLIPNPAADLLLASTRAKALEPVATLTTVRRPVEIRDGEERLLAEVVDDTVSVSQDRHPASRFREIEVEVHASGRDGRRVMKAAVSRLVKAGCDAESPMPKLVRALGEPATRPPDVPVPALTARATATDLVQHAVARSVAQIIRHDPGARLGDDIEDVHQLRVATRRLRSDLHSFAPLLDTDRLAPVRVELGWLGRVVGAVRDNDVLAARLADHVTALPDVYAPGVTPLLSVLEREASMTRSIMLTVLRDARYLQLLDTLVEVATAPPFVQRSKLSKRSPQKIASTIARRPWRRLAAAVAALDADPSDAELHQVRILAKRCRYAAEAVAPLGGKPAARFAAAIADLQTVLGDHQDTVLAETWLTATARAAPAGLATAGQLIALEQSRRMELRAEWPAVWKKASSRKLRSWM